MKKMNKKGFTLIEMLAVIAIIAVLVAIIVPAVGSSTDKAKASTDAANLRSVMSTATIEYAENGSLTGLSTSGVSKSKLIPACDEIVVGQVGDQIVAYYTDGTNYYAVADFAAVADGAVKKDAITKTGAVITDGVTITCN